MITKKIKKVSAIEILDSRGNPTLEVSLELLGGEVGKASVPSGKSTGAYEAFELRDGDKERYNGLGVLKAVENVNVEIQENIFEKDFDQKSLDQALVELDGTENKSRLGANAILGVSLAFARAYAESKHLELYEYIGNLADNKNFKLPEPALNIINGGKHSDSGLDIQEFMILPEKFDSFRKKIEVAEKIISSLKNKLQDMGQVISVGDEGGFAPKLSSNEGALDLLCGAIKDAGYSLDEVKIGIDVAASSFYKDGVYQLKISGETENKTTDEMMIWYEDLVKKYPIVSIEDGLAEDDFEGFRKMTEKFGDRVEIVGDDLTVTNVKRIQTAIQNKSINSVLIKLNQIGTLSETVEAVKLTQAQGWATFISHRSGETEDTFIADLSVGLACDYIKSGSLERGERVCKYNRLMEIENILNKK